MYFRGDRPDMAAIMKGLALIVQEMPGLYEKYNENELLSRPSPGKWSKKEILGHLVDSAINNLKRFTEIQFLPSPYQLRSYRQEELVKANHYQDLPIDHLLLLWKSLNQQILYVVQHLSEEQVQLPFEAEGDVGQRHLGFLIADYVAHLSHHIAQIRN